MEAIAPAPAPEPTPGPALEPVPFDLDPFSVPPPTNPPGAAEPRRRVVVHGTVWDHEVVAWEGGAVHEVTLVGDGGRLTLVFFGPRGVGGLQAGRRLAAAGTVVAHRDRSILLNPQVWLRPTGVAPGVAVGAGSGRAAGRLRRGLRGLPGLSGLPGLPGLRRVPGGRLLAGRR